MIISTSPPFNYKPIILVVKNYTIIANFWFFNESTTFNIKKQKKNKLYLIPFLHQTTTRHHPSSTKHLLYLIPFLHQTTTKLRLSLAPFQLYLIPFLHQTTTINGCFSSATCCILFHFYIKPQPFAAVLNITICCILFHFYIKPQLLPSASATQMVVSYSISTSNHNRLLRHKQPKRLYLIPFLHQTTTLLCQKNNARMLYLIPFLHQTTTCCRLLARSKGCILFHFYIKPQPQRYAYLPR